MTEAMFLRALKEAQTKAGEGGEATAGEGRRLTLYAGHGGVSLTVARVESVKLSEGAVRAKNDKGEIFLLALEDVFAVSAEAGTSGATTRKAGFLGG
jgi:hypothetical protein